MKMNSNIVKILHLLGGLLVVAGALLYFFEVNLSKYIFALGVITLLFVQGNYLFWSKNSSIKIQRIQRIMFMATLLLGFGVYLMFVGNSFWVVLMFIYAVISVFLTFRS